MTRLATLDLTWPDDDDPGRDRPARQRLREVVAITVRWSARAPARADRTPLIEAGLGLAQRAGFLAEAATLLLAALRTDQDRHTEIAGPLQLISELLTSEPVTAARLADVLAHRMTTDQRAEPEAVRAASELLAREGQLPTGLFALALANYGSRLGWPAEWRAIVRALREHPVPSVRTAAFTVALAPE